MGHDAKVMFTKDLMTIVGDGSTQDAANQRVAQIKNLIEVAEQEYEKEKRNDRIAKLSGGVVVIQVVAQTETEKRTVEEGIAVVGGCILLRLASKVDAIKDSLENDEEKRALSFPLKLIAKNAGANGSIVSDKVLSNDNPKFGYNAATGEYEDLMAAGIIDLTKVSFRVNVILEMPGMEFKEELSPPIVEAARNDSGKASHSAWRNYDDFNEYFWSRACFDLGWPLKRDSSFLMKPKKRKKERYFVGRGLYERTTDYLRYVLYWLVIFACNFMFAYFLQASSNPLILS
ncbi:hypothetical protein RHGRI_023851 [Rhododendron griersonianum]|uniref:1,3-beta-glucan synthase component FKS1-like domain-containing protein n=1 Tax=Rhododendron griersonianum TaxID=479676 RepID=A0AAV6J970_9ERIC|nr:hypothetical protein RHGRI_023851 [Rhododendron griersonianum]